MVCSVRSLLPTSRASAVKHLHGDSRQLFPYAAGIVICRPEPAGNAPLPKSKRKPGVRSLSGVGVYIHISGSGDERHSSCWRWSERCCRSSSQGPRWTCCCSCHRAARRATDPPGRSTHTIFGTFPMQTRPGNYPGRGAIIVVWRISFRPLWLSIRRSAFRSPLFSPTTRHSCERSAGTARFRPCPCR